MVVMVAVPNTTTHKEKATAAGCCCDRFNGIFLRLYGLWVVGLFVALVAVPFVVESKPVSAQPCQPTDHCIIIVSYVRGDTILLRLLPPR
jgi:hypothetical protein